MDRWAWLARSRMRAKSKKNWFLKKVIGELMFSWKVDSPFLFCASSVDALTKSANNCLCIPCIWRHDLSKRHSKVYSLYSSAVLETHPKHKPQKSPSHNPQATFNFVKVQMTSWYAVFFSLPFFFLFFCLSSFSPVMSIITLNIAGHIVQTLFETVAKMASPERLDLLVVNDGVVFVDRDWKSVQLFRSQLTLSFFHVGQRNWSIIGWLGTLSRFFILLEQAFGRPMSIFILPVSSQRLNGGAQPAFCKITSH